MEVKGCFAVMTIIISAVIDNSLTRGERNAPNRMGYKFDSRLAARPYRHIIDKEAAWKTSHNPNLVPFYQRYTDQFGYARRELDASSCNITEQGYAQNTVGTKCYKFHSEPRTWYRAVNTCIEEGSQLAIITSADESKTLTDLLRKHVGSRNDFTIFVGFHDLFREGEYMTLDGNPLSESGYTWWDYAQPDNHLGDENCGAIHINGRLNDVHCTLYFPFICERYIGPQCL